MDPATSCIKATGMDAELDALKGDEKKEADENNEAARM